MQNKILVILSIVLFVSCTPDIPGDGDFLKWSTFIEIPLFKDSITLETLAEDSLISIENLSNYLLIISNNSTSKINKLLAGIVGLGLDP